MCADWPRKRPSPASTSTTMPCAATIPSLRERLSPLTREMKWLSTGPLIFSNRLEDPPSPGTYYAGDALSFVDCCTGSGLYCAVLTGEIAGNSAAFSIPPAGHVKRCRRALGRPSRSRRCSAMRLPPAGLDIWPDDPSPCPVPAHASHFPSTEPLGYARNH